jgi:hypothetical protein
MKTKLVGLFSLLLLSAQMRVFANGPATVNENLIKAFKETFPKASTVEWQENKDSYFVHFKENSITTEIEYDHNGNFIESERYYTDIDMLPLHLACDLHKKFGSKTVFGITETNNDVDNFYYVKLQDDKEWITVKGNAQGILEVVERYNKQQ